MAQIREKFLSYHWLKRVIRVSGMGIRMHENVRPGGYCFKVAWLITNTMCTQCLVYVKLSLLFNND